MLSFQHIVKTGSFTKASKQVFRSQPALSHHIRELEQFFDVKLFNRLGNKIELTQEGEMLFNFTCTIFSELETLKKTLKEIAKGEEGGLSLAISRSMMIYRFADIITNFLNQYPKIKCKLITRNNVARMQEMILSGEIDLGLGIKSQLISPKIGFYLWKIFDRVLVTDKDHPLTNELLTLKNIAKYPIIITRMGLTKKVVEEVFYNNGIDFEITMEVDSPEIVKKFLVNRKYVSIFSSIAITEEDERNLSIYNVKHFFGSVEYGIYYSKVRPLTPTVRRFINFFAPELNASSELDNLKPMETFRT